MMFNTLFNRGKFVFLCLPVFLLVCYHGYGQRWVAEHAKAIITPSLVEQTTSRLGSYMVKSRENPELALDSAGSFIARQFESFGLQPLNGSYFQDIRFCTFDLGSDIFLSIVKDLETKNYVLKKDFVPLNFRDPNRLRGISFLPGTGSQPRNTTTTITGMLMFREKLSWYSGRNRVKPIHPRCVSWERNLPVIRSCRKNKRWRWNMALLGCWSFPAL